MTAPDAAVFDDMVRAAYTRLPAYFRDLAADVVVRTAEVAERDILEELDILSPLDLLGLYQGVNVLERSVYSTGDLPDMVFLYRQPILHFWQTDEAGNDLDSIIRHVLVHEIGHHFGLSDEDMHRLEDAAEDEERAR